MCTVKKRASLLMLVVCILQTGCNDIENVVMVMEDDFPSSSYEVLQKSELNVYSDPYAHVWDISHHLRSRTFRSPLLDLWDLLNVTEVSIYYMNVYNDTLASLTFDAEGKSLMEWFGYPLNPTPGTAFNITGMFGFDFLWHVSNKSAVLSGNLYKGDSENQTSNRFIFGVNANHWTLPTPDRECVNISDDNGVMDSPALNLTVHSNEECIFACYRFGSYFAILTIFPNIPGAACGCWNQTIETTSGWNETDDCGLPCPGDANQFCGDWSRHGFVVYQTNSIDDILNELNAEEYVVTRTIGFPAGYSTIDVDKDAMLLTKTADDCSYLSSLEIVTGDQPAITMRYNDQGCSYAFKTLRDDNDTQIFYNIGRRYNFDMLKVRCIELEETNPNQTTAARVRLGFKNSTVLLASHFAITARWKTDQCQVEDITRQGAFFDTSQMSVYHSKSGNSISDITSQLTLKYSSNVHAPVPKVIISVHENDKQRTWMSSIRIHTNVMTVSVNITGSCNSSKHTWIETQTAGSSLTGSQQFNYNFADNNGSIICADRIEITIEQPTDDLYLLGLEINGCINNDTEILSACPDVRNLLQDGTILLSNVRIFSSYSYMGATHPCNDGLSIKKWQNEPLVLTMTVPQDELVDSLPVESFSVNASDVNSILIEVKYSRTETVFTAIPKAQYSIDSSGEVLSLVYQPKVRMFAIQIIHDTANTHHVINSIAINACVYDKNIIKGKNVTFTFNCTKTNKTESVETDTTTQSTTDITTQSTTDITTISTSTTVQSNTSCCRCVPVATPITLEEAEKLAEEIARELVVDKNTLSSTIRKKTSAKDDRPSAKVVGSLGIVLLTFTVALVVIMDLSNCVQLFQKVAEWLKMKRSQNAPKTSSA